MKRLTTFLTALTALFFLSQAAEVDYTEGIIVINEDWYGHQNSTINYLLPDDPDNNYWYYRVIQTENPGMELGCTNQYGALWDDRLYLIAKQEKDPGASIVGGRITVVDAKTMKIIKQLEKIDPSGKQCDGRAFVGVSDKKGYVSSSNGIWVLNLETLEIEGQVEGSANPNAGGSDDKPNSDPTSSLYYGQTGTMVLAEGKVFAVHQQYGLLVVDPTTDKVIEILDMDIIDDAIEEETGKRPKVASGIGSTVVRAKDGSLWYSAAKNTQGGGATVPYIVRLDPTTLERDVIRIDESMYPPSNSWYAWTPDPFCASSVSNTLYWCGGPNTWFSSSRVFKYDIDKGTLTEIIDLTAQKGNWKIYGCSLGIHPESDELFVSLYHEFTDPTYMTARYDSNGNLLKNYPMVSNYWFPSLFVFPQGKHQYSAIEGISDENRDDSADTTGNLYTIGGIRVATDVSYGNWGELHPGIYIWRSASRARKVMIK